MLSVSRLLGMVRGHTRLGARLAQGSEELGRSPQAGDERRPRHGSGDLYAAGFGHHRTGMMTGHSIVLSPLERRHLEATRAWANDPELMRLLDRARPVSDEEHEKWFSELQGRADCVYFV